MARPSPSMLDDSPPVGSPQANRAAIASHPNASAACVEGASHFMLTDEPEATLAAVQGLLVGLVQHGA